VPPAEADVCNDRYRFNLEIRQQRSCRQFTLRANRVIQDLHSAFRRIKPAQLLHGWNAEPSSRRVRSTRRRQVHESSFWTSQEEYETSRGRSDDDDDVALSTSARVVAAAALTAS